MKYVKRVLFILLAAFLVIQFIPTKRNESNEILPSDISSTYNVHEKVQSLLKTSCYDCHSDKTNYPWYNKIQPLSWILESHITKGKKELNFSEFGTYSIRNQKSKLKSMSSQIKDGEMPLPSYTLIHRNAIFTESEKSLLLEWIDNLRASLWNNLGHSTKYEALPWYMIFDKKGMVVNDNASHPGDDKNLSDLFESLIMKWSYSHQLNKRNHRISTSIFFSHMVFVDECDTCRSIKDARFAG